MKSKINIIVTLQIPGIHRWSECNIPEVDYLRKPHRHNFHITCKKRVQKTDREIEIILLRNEIFTYLNKQYYSEERGMLNFGEMSCEMISAILCDRFALIMCQVMEDGENGAEVCYE